jgi:hypothetical protein
MLNNHQHLEYDIKLENVRNQIANSKEGKVNIKGKIYSTVGLRLFKLREIFGTRVSIKTSVLENSEDKVFVKAEIFFNYENGQIMISDGYAEKRRNLNMITKNSAVEFCQTTALGRSLAFLGLSGSNEIASAEEIFASEEQIAEKEVETKLGKKESEDDI